MSQWGNKSGKINLHRFLLAQQPIASDQYRRGFFYDRIFQTEPQIISSRVTFHTSMLLGLGVDLFILLEYELLLVFSYTRNCEIISSPALSEPADDIGAESTESFWQGFRYIPHRAQKLTLNSSNFSKNELRNI